LLTSLLTVICYDWLWLVFAAVTTSGNGLGSGCEMYVCCNLVCCRWTLYSLIDGVVIVIQEAMQILFLGRLFWVDLITYIHPSTKSSFDFREFGLLVEVDELCTTLCSLTQSKVKVTSTWKLEIFHFQKLSALPFTMGGGNWPRIVKLGHSIYIWSAGILIFVLVFVSRDFELGRNVRCEESIVSPIGIIFITSNIIIIILQ